MNLPQDFRQRMLDMHGPRGEMWLARLPNLIAECERRWSLQVLPPFQLSYNYAAPAVDAHGQAFVLKLGLPSDELLREIAALRLYDGRGICRLIDADAERGILLLERLLPGTMLSEQLASDLSPKQDETATRIAAQAMRDLWRPAPTDHALASLTRWTAGLEKLRTQFDGTTGPFPGHLVECAERWRAELLSNPPESVVLHGDLHHFNILQAGQTRDGRAPWLAIDPKGVVGERAYEIASFLYNPSMEGILQMSKPVDFVARRIDIFTEHLQLDRQRVIGWALVQAVLSGWWSYEDEGHGWEPVLAFAEVVAQTF